MDFAPYQSSPPESNRPFSPSPPPSRTLSPFKNPYAAAARSPPPLHHPQPQRSWQGLDGSTGAASYQNEGSGGSSYPEPTHVVGLNDFDTSLGLRLDYEAVLAYLAVPPIGAIVLLILERNSDYVRFHAWQSALLFTAIGVIHLLFSWSRFLSWVLFIGDLALIALLSLRAYRDAEILDRYEVPFFGRVASNILDDE